MDGIILIDKEQDRTSFDLVRRVRGILKIKKVGHAGTLDPFATGLLILLLGQGTKISSFLMNEKKVYLASIRLGIETDTSDPTGKIVRTKKVPYLNRERIEDGLSCFQGEIDQRPPAFSAVKYQGRRAYKLAREGIQFELKKRRVKIFRIELLDVDLPRLIIRVSCSGGTYIRSLVSDIGEHFGTLGCLESLRRLSSGSFKVEEAYRFPERGETERSRLIERIVPLHKCLPGMAAVNVDNRLASKIRNGYQPAPEEVMSKSGGVNYLNEHVKLTRGSELIALAKLDRGERGREETGRLKLVRVFPEQKSSPRP